MFYKPGNDILLNSFYVNPVPYIKLALRLGELKSDVRSKLLTKQELKCGICNKNIISLNDIIN